MRKQALIYGASGFVGGGLAKLLENEGYEITGVSRKAGGGAEGVSRWVKPEGAEFRGCDVVVNLAGFTLNYGTYALMVASMPVVAAYPILGVAAGSIVGMFANFAVSRRLVFRG